MTSEPERDRPGDRVREVNLETRNAETVRAVSALDNELGPRQRPAVSSFVPTDWFDPHGLRVSSKAQFPPELSLRHVAISDLASVPARREPRHRKRS